MHTAENEVRDLKRSASSHPEDQSLVVKKKCIEEVVRQIWQLQEEHRISTRRAASQQIITSQERKRRGLAPAAPPRGIMANMEMYFNWRGFNWRGLGAAHRPPINTEWVIDLLRNTLELDEDMLNDMGGAIRSEIFGAALIMMQSLMLVEMPDWMPMQ
jgi:hypothetical protein